jgi:hypothetical protein
MGASLHNVSYLPLARLTKREGEQRWREVGPSVSVPMAGVYAIYHDGALVYIGSSSRLRHRISTYFGKRGRTTERGGPKPPSADVRVVVKVAGSRRLGDWLMREYRLIQRLRPSDNNVFTGYRPYAKKAGRNLVCLACVPGHSNTEDLTACERAFGNYEGGRLVPHGGAFADGRCLDSMLQARAAAGVS